MATFFDVAAMLPSSVSSGWKRWIFFCQLDFVLIEHIEDVDLAVQHRLPVCDLRTGSIQRSLAL